MMVIFIVSIVFICLGQKLESLKNVWTNKYFSSVVMPSEDTKILEFNQNQKSDRTSFILYENLESVMDKIGIKNIE